MLDTNVDYRGLLEEVAAVVEHRARMTRVLTSGEQPQMLLSNILQAMEDRTRLRNPYFMQAEIDVSGISTPMGGAQQGMFFFCGSDVSGIRVTDRVKAPKSSLRTSTLRQEFVYSRAVVLHGIEWTWMWRPLGVSQEPAHISVGLNLHNLGLSIGGGDDGVHVSVIPGRTKGFIYARDCACPDVDCQCSDRKRLLKLFDSLQRVPRRHAPARACDAPTWHSLHGTYELF